MTTDEIIFPYGHCDQQALADAATMTQTIKNTLTQITREGGFGAAVTGLSLLANPNIRKGSRVSIRIEQGATGRNVTFGSAGSTITAPVLTGVANDIDVIELEWTGLKFRALTTWQKVVDAA
jgi:hypothetical protein